MSKIEPDMQPRVDREISNFRVFMITSFVAFGGFLFGYDCVIGGGLPEVKQFALDFGTPQPPDGKYGFPAALKGGFVSILSVGTFMGALSASQFADRLGRRLGLMITCVIFAVGIAVQTWASSIAVLMVGRWIAGYAVGLVSVMIPLYQAECVPARRRGAIVSCYQLAITIGLLVGQIVAFATKDREDVNAYRILIGLQFVWSGILALAMFFFPETPRYLIRAGKWEAAVASKEELQEIKANYEWEKLQGSATYADCWRGLNRKRTLLGIFMQAWQQLTGVNFIFYYGPSFFKAAGLDDSFKVSMIMGTVNCLCTFPGLFLMDRIGRRRLLLWGAVVQLVSHFLVGIIHVATGGKAPIWTAVFSGTFIAAFAATWGPCAWVITSELFGLKTRAKQMSFAVAGNWGFNTLLGQISPMMSGDADHPVLGVNVAFVWGALNVGCWAYVYFFIPELKVPAFNSQKAIMANALSRFERGISPRDSANFRPTRKYATEVDYRDQHEMKAIGSPDLKDDVSHHEDVDPRQ